MTRWKLSRGGEEGEWINSVFRVYKYPATYAALT